MKTLLKNATVIPMTQDKYTFSSDILIQDGKINTIGKIDSSSIDKIIDCTGKIVLPAFVNGHTHLSMTLMRNYKDDTEDLFQWLSQIWPIEDKLNEEDIYWASLLGNAEMIKCGCTTFADMYFMTWKTIEACKKAGTRGIIGLTFFGDEEETKRRLRELVPKIDDAISGDDMFRVDAAVHSIYTCTAGTYEIAKDWARGRNTFLNTHLSETEKEVLDCISENNVRPVDYLDKLGVLDDKTYLAHGVWFDNNEMETIQNRGCSIIHNPSSNCKLASGIAPISEYREKGINVALGTDGASSNNNLNILKEMNLASMLSSVSTRKPSALSPYEILKMATINGAKALGLDDKIGTIEEGKEADVIVMDMDKLHTSPTNDIFSSIIFASDKENIEYVFSKGEMLLDQGNLTTLDEEEIKINIYQQWNDILNR